MEQLILEIKKALHEDLGIRLDVKNAFNNIKTLIVRDSKWEIYRKDEAGNMVKTGAIKNVDVFKGVKINIRYHIIYCETADEINEKKRCYPYTCYFSQEQNTLSTMLFYINDKRMYFDDSSQHELDHVYKALLTKQKMLSKKVTRDIYQRSVSEMHSDDLTIRYISYVIYYNNRFERDAFANTIYSNIMQNKDMDMYDVVLNSNLYKNVTNIKYYINNLTQKETSKIEDYVFQTYGKHFKWWYNMAQNVVKQYIRKIGRAMAKAKKDIEGENPNIFGGPDGLIKEE